MPSTCPFKIVEVRGNKYDVVSNTVWVRVASNINKRVKWHVGESEEGFGQFESLLCLIQVAHLKTAVRSSNSSPRHRRRSLSRQKVQPPLLLLELELQLGMEMLMMRRRTHSVASAPVGHAAGAIASHTSSMLRVTAMTFR